MKCPRHPEKVRYQKAVFAWNKGAFWSKKSGIPLYLYRCDHCGGWHLTKWSDGPNSTLIDTANLRSA